jgi:hypothetical protein
MSFQDYSKIDTMTEDTERVIMRRNVGRFRPPERFYRPFFKAAIVMAAFTLPILIISFPFFKIMGGSRTIDLFSIITWLVCTLGANVASLAALIIFFRWIYRACGNLLSFNHTGLWFSPVWSVAWFFIPLANLVVPYLITEQILKKSAGFRSDLAGKEPPPEPPTKWMNLWWAFTWIPVVFAIAMFYFTLGDLFRMTPGSPSLLMFEIVERITLLLAVARVGFTLMLMRQINSLQEETFKKMKSDPLLVEQQPPSA